MEDELAWIDDFIQWCRDQRQAAAEHLAEYEAGRMRLYQNDVDVSDRQAASLRRVVEKMDAMIARAERDRNA